MSQSLICCLRWQHPCWYQGLGGNLPSEHALHHTPAWQKVACSSTWLRATEATSSLTCYGRRGRCRIFNFNSQVFYLTLTPRWPRCNNLPETATYTCYNLLSAPEPKPPLPPLFTKQNNKVTQIEGDNSAMTQRLRASVGWKTLPALKPERKCCAECKSDRNFCNFEQQDDWNSTS